VSALRGLFLDFDGTIAETERHGHLPAYNRAFSDFDLDWTWDEALYGELLRVAGGKERIAHYVRAYRSDRDAPDEAFIRRLHETKVRHFAAMAPTIPFRRGVVRLIEAAHAAGVRIAIATTSSEAGVEALIGQRPDVRAKIDLIAGAESAPRKKPAPDVYLHALERLGLDPRACVAIEDSNNGLRAAVAAGIATVVTVSDYTRGEDFSAAAAVFPDLGEPGDERLVDLPLLERIVTR
jgi:HAD superfamily hydrolase (TIGR01509 family)